MRGATAAFFIAVLSTGSVPAVAEVPSDTEVRRIIIQESLSTYPGNCPCPWNSDRAGRSCGQRSAYSRPGGYAPKCYIHDISDDEVRAYRRTHGI